ncbi:hypothetical protein [Pseudoalteromonas piscicida]|uniref:Uncharacterized protein n=1 Tax=Pseudoalteromonas piscicida TaxID=43662 RepID=A0A2A5JM16_PSEO7|nr:hypothetical protein [Pseudoalteromonas piscicida]PCK30470.1 hypothetical protein CEX98_17780 [Pseudoalteromonas piscicida]
MKPTLLSLLIGCAFSSQAATWSEMYNLELNQHLPSVTTSNQQQIDTQNYLVSALHVNLNDVLASAREHNTIVIAADTLDIDRNMIFDAPNKRVFILARRITGNGTLSVNVDTQNAQASTLAIMADKVETNINIITTHSPSDGEIERFSVAPDSFGTLYQVVQGNKFTTPISPELTSLISVHKEYFLDAFEKSFDMAASIYDQNPALSIEMLSWPESILNAASDVRESSVQAKNFYLQLANFKQFLSYATLNKNYVPSLSRDFYELTIKAYIDAMEAYQNSYNNFQQQGRSLENKRQDLTLMQDNLFDIASAEQRIISRSVEQLTSLVQTLDEQKTSFGAQENNVFNSGVDFQQGILDYKLNKITEIGLKVLETVISAGTAFAGAAGGDTSGLKELVASLPATIQEINELKTKIDDIASLMDKVQTVSGQLNVLSQKTADPFSSSELAQEFNRLNSLIPNKEEANRIWDEFLITVKAQMKKAIDEDIDGASDYLIAIEKLINHGKAIVAVEIDIAQEQSRQIDLRITADAKLKQINRIDAFLQNNQNSIDEVQQMEEQLFRTLNNLKRPIFVALTNYQAAFSYWSLDDSIVTPSLNQSYQEYRRDLALLREQEAASLLRFTPRPQDFMLTIEELDSPQQLADFAQDGEMSFTLSLNDIDFSQFDRVRLDEVNVILEGPGLNEDQRYDIEVRSSGSYQDRFKGQNYQFSAESLYRLISYELIDSQTTQINPITTGAISGDYAINYFKPTPFTTWSIKLKNPALYDLSKVTNIKVSFSGNAIPKQ